MRFGFSISLLVGAALVACPGPTFIVQQYKGPVRERETIAILRVNGADSVRLLRLDDDDIGVPVQEDARLHIEILPGRHRVVVANAKAPSERYDPLEFMANADRVYRIVFAEANARVHEVDRESDKLVSDVTRAAPPPEQLPPIPKPKPAPKAEADAGAPNEGPTAVDAGAP